MTSPLPNNLIDLEPYRKEREKQKIAEKKRKSKEESNKLWEMLRNGRTKDMTSL
jgi:hypothetical protein